MQQLAKKIKYSTETKLYTENELSTFVFNAALNVHKILGPGLLQYAYLECMYYELAKQNLFVEKHKSFPIIYDNQKLPVGFKIDLHVNNKLIIKIKNEQINKNDIVEILTYLKLSKCKLGMIINFNVALIKNGVKRVVNNL